MFAPLVIWENILFTDTGLFILFVILVATAIGLLSRFMQVGIVTGFLVFVHFAVESQLQPYYTLLYALLTLFAVIMGVQVYQIVTQSSGGSPT